MHRSKPHRLFDHFVGARENADALHPLGLRSARRERPRRRTAQEFDEVAPSHAKLPVEDKAYQRAALCVTAKLAANRSRLAPPSYRERQLHSRQMKSVRKQLDRRRSTFLQAPVCAS
jgi:hypothetical protein